MSSMPADQNHGAKSPPGPKDNSHPLPAARKRSRRKFLLPGVLFIIGAALLLTAWMLYPRTPERPSPAANHLTIASTTPLSYIEYDITQHADTGKAELDITLTAANKRGARGAGAGIVVRPPAGTHLVRCKPACTKPYWSEELSFGNSTEVTATIYMRAHDFGMVSGRVTTSVMIPEIDYESKGTPTAYVGYNIPSASSYDWSSYPPTSIEKSSAVWNEDLTQRVTGGRIAVGINPAARKIDDTKTFIAGALLGLGGGALLSAVQEAARKDD